LFSPEFDESQWLVFTGAKYDERLEEGQVAENNLIAIMSDEMITIIVSAKNDRNHFR